MRSIFLLVDVERVLWIPFSEHLDEDFVAWRKTISYRFFVQSAYYAEWEHQYGAKPRCCNIQACSGTIEIWSPYTTILAVCFLIAGRLGSISF